MTTEDIIRGISERVEEIGITRQQLADASGVPKSTIDRIMRGDTSNPSIQTILDLAGAVGYSFGNHPEQEPALPGASIKDPVVKQLITVYENRGMMYEERIKRITAHFNMLLAEKNRWLKFSMTLNVIFVVFFCMIVFIDVLNPDVGWVREMFHSVGTRSVGETLSVWIDWFKTRTFV